MVRFANGGYTVNAKFNYANSRQFTFLIDLLHPPPAKAKGQLITPTQPPDPASENRSQFEMSEEEERELAELLADG